EGRDGQGARRDGHDARRSARDAEAAVVGPHPAPPGARPPGRVGLGLRARGRQVEEAPCPPGRRAEEAPPDRRLVLTARLTEPVAELPSEVAGEIPNRLSLGRG